MTELALSLRNKAAKYGSMDDTQKRQLIHKLYEEHNMSWRDMADICGTYANKIRRDATKLGFKSRDKSEAQKLALATGRHKHPTKGVGHSDASKEKISDKIADNWRGLSDAEKKGRAEVSRKNWEAMPKEKREAMQRAAVAAVRETSKTGSKLEFYIREQLAMAEYKVLFHREHMIENANMHIDLTIPELKIAIEIDGPSHFSPIWSEEQMRKVQLADAEKDALLLSKGWAVIRVQQRKSLSDKYKRELRDNLLNIIHGLENKWPTQATKRHFIIGA